jgi:hypothetical protein
MRRQIPAVAVAAIQRRDISEIVYQRCNIFVLEAEGGRGRQGEEWWTG